jgi:CubicO group peptidase (beta-lactamase class C family)
MTRFWLAPLAVALATLASALADPPDAAPLPASFDLPAVDAYVARQAREKGYVGLALTVVREGKIVLATRYGKVSLDGPAVSVDTPFAIGSVTKQFACACIFLLAEEGKLSVRDPVAKYYPDLTRASDITLYDLMSHASGYPDYYPLDFVDRRLVKPIAPDDLIREYAGGKLDFEPGTRWSYSNTGYIILGRVVEKVSGEPFGRFLERRILKPLGMAHAVFEPPPDAPGLARGHTSFALGPAEPATPESAGWLYAAGGLYAAAPDLARWDLALMEGKVLKPESYRLMTSPRELAGGRTHDYGCGLTVSRRNGETVLSHGGAVSGFLAQNALIPRTKSAVILLSNAEHVDLAALHRELLGLLLKDQARREEDVPIVQGPSTKEAAIALFRQMQAGAVDRSKLGEEFSLYMSEERVREAAPRLKALGEPTAVEVENTGERGGMEASVVRFTFPSGTVKVNMFRSPDGKIQQFLLSRS